MALAASSPALLAQGTPQASESDVKAAYLYQFTKYIEWPDGAAGASDTLTMCVAGDMGVAKGLQKIASDEAGSGRKVVVRQDPDVAATADCRVLFVGRVDDQRFAGLVKALAGKPTLIAGDDLSILRRGGIVAFVVQDKKVRFGVSLTAAEAAHLKVSSQLLRHAVQVIQ